MIVSRTNTGGWSFPHPSTLCSSRQGPVAACPSNRPVLMCEPCSGTHGPPVSPWQSWVEICAVLSNWRAAYTCVTTALTGILSCTAASGLKTTDTGRPTVCKAWLVRSCVQAGSPAMAWPEPSKQAAKVAAARYAQCGWILYRDFMGRVYCGSCVSPIFLWVTPNGRCW